MDDRLMGVLTASLGKQRLFTPQFYKKVISITTKAKEIIELVKSILEAAEMTQDVNEILKKTKLSEKTKAKIEYTIVTKHLDSWDSYQHGTDENGTLPDDTLDGKYKGQANTKINSVKVKQQ